MDLRDGIVDPLADERMPVLVDGEVVFARGDEGVCGVEGADVEDCVDGDGEEVGEREEEGVLGVEGRGMWWWGRHGLDTGVLLVKCRSEGGGYG